MESRYPVFVKPPTVGDAARERTKAAHSLDLSTNEQVVSFSRETAVAMRRLRRLKMVVIGAANKTTEWMQKGGFRYRAAMITTTYRPGQHWEPKDISKLMDHYRQWLRKRGHTLRAVWTLELQKRGAPHYHIVLWLPRGLTPPKPDKAGWWKKGATNCTWAYRPVGYLAKYASKGPGDQRDLPKGARLYGIYGCPVNLGWWRAPAWMRKIAEQGWKIVKRPGGWWCVPELATAWRSPWILLSCRGPTIEIKWKGWGNNDIMPLWELEATGAIKPVMPA